MAGRTVPIGTTLCEIADFSGWQLLLDVPQDDIGWVQRALAQRQDDPDLPLPGVKFALAAFPEHPLTAVIDSPDRIAQRGEMTQEGNVFTIRVDMDAESVAPIRTVLRDGSVGRAKIDTCKRPLGYVLCRKVIRFFPHDIYLIRRGVIRAQPCFSRIRYGTRMTIYCRIPPPLPIRLRRFRPHGVTWRSPSRSITANPVMCSRTRPACDTTACVRRSTSFSRCWTAPPRSSRS